MFSKHRKWLLRLLCLLSALLLALGGTVFSEQWNEDFPLSTTAPRGTSIRATVPTVDVRMPSSEPSEPAGSNEYVGDAQERSLDRSLRPYLHAGSLFLGIVLGILFLLIKQTKPMLGPEVDLSLIVVTLLVGERSFGTNHILVALTAWLLISLLLFCSRELLSWMRTKCTLDWSLAHRAGAFFSRNGKKGLYLLSCLAAVLLGISGILFVVLRGIGYQDFWWFAVRCAGPALMLILAIACLLRFGKAVESLSDRIRVLYEEGTVTEGGGPFEREQMQLAALGDRMEEAIRTAVTGERFKVDLIANVSHDLRTPLTAIVGYGELLEGETLSETGREQLARLNQKAGYMRDLVESLFELTKVSSGVLDSKREEIDLIRLLEQTMGLLDDQLTAASLQVRRHYCAEQVQVMTDGARMHQVFANLLGNAIKYALPGTRIHLEVKGGETVTVRMTNIASYEMDFSEEEILQRFARGDKARSTSGSGIGLAIAKTYTESVGGTFRIVIDGDQFSAIVEIPKTERES